ncbi:MAG: bifunctional 4-hydroxy-2-oxoglutarate aldolase/2-dehydro-3-deoxy-phosphogluconate aldolase [Chloroflexota bacterium]|nr:bifunctional 4-hydroxy-2-oxoglutarate aldolase/2-dehydro-3-deoxy-phosphogluconate aldolase [Chloroflexota bacterium]
MSAQELRDGDVARIIRAHRLIAILRRVESGATLLGLVDDLAAAGVRVFEITLDSASGATDLVAVRERLAGVPDALIGAGTVLSGEQLQEAIEARADFAVSPLFDRELTAAALRAGLPFIPGAMTPAEISVAWEAGATFVKLFPASALGPTFVRELHGPMPDVALIPTGGVDAENAGAFLSAGAAAVGIGGAMVRGTPDERRQIMEAVRKA